MELWQLDATDVGQRIRTGEASAREAVEACLARLRAVNPAINAVVRTLDEEALVPRMQRMQPVPAAKRWERCTACRSRPRSMSTRPGCQPTTAWCP
jgi:Asp-tRNA(Asn)/Glu-tRNA(Gln) amidotransferase A subunit family amidase